MSSSSHYDISVVGSGEGEGEGRVVLVQGEIDMSAVADLKACIDRARAGGRPLVIDMAATTFLDSSGLHALLRAQREQDRQGAVMRIRSPSAPVMHVMKLAGVEDRIPIEHAGEVR